MSLDYPLIPDQAFLYFPPKQQILQVRQGKQYRIIFDGGVQFTQDEKNKVEELKNQMAKKQKNDNIRTFTDNVLLRFLQATQFNNTNCIKALREFKVWQEKNLPIKLTSQIQNLLKQGILYMSGRDCCYRPILVVNVGKILEIAPKQKLFLDTLGYFFQFIIQNCLIQGQVENWVSIIDLGNASVFSLGGTLVDTITYLSSTFRARVHHSYLLNAPSSIKWVWGMVKGALNEDQLRKLTLLGKKQLSQQHFTQINQSQVEVKYGGTRSNITNFWPIPSYEYNFSAPMSKNVILISKQEYNTKYQRYELEKRKVNYKFVKKPRKQRGYQTQRSFMSRRSFQEENELTRSRSSIEYDLNQLNMRIPKQKYPPQIPDVPESFTFENFINNLINRFFP